MSTETVPTVPIIYIALPTYDGAMQKQTLIRAMRHPRPDRFNITYADHGGNSLLARGFNFEWACALVDHSQGRCSHFAMLHADIIPDHDWLGILLDEMDRTGADVMSAVSPIKGFDPETGDMDTSTAIGRRDCPFSDIHRIPMSVLAKLPETFSIEDVQCYEYHQLLVNTGCLLVKLGDWCHELNENNELKVFFTIRDRIRKDGSNYVVDAASEDWNFSRMADAGGAKVMATRKVRLVHRGAFDFTNQVAEVQ